MKSNKIGQGIALTIFLYFVIFMKFYEDKPNNDNVTFVVVGKVSAFEGGSVNGRYSFAVSGVLFSIKKGGGCDPGYDFDNGDRITVTYFGDKLGGVMYIREFRTL